MPDDLDVLTQILRTQLAAVNQQFFHILALRQWNDETLLPVITEVDKSDFRNAMRIIGLLVAKHHPISLEAYCFAPGSDFQSILQSELHMERAFAAQLDGVRISDPRAIVLVEGALKPRAGYRAWLIERTGTAEPYPTPSPPQSARADFVALLVRLVEQAMMHAYVQRDHGYHDAADTAWRISGAAMLYGTAIVRRGALSNAIQAPSEIGILDMALDPVAAAAADRSLVEACADAGRRAAEEEVDDKMARLLCRIAGECDRIAKMNAGDKLPAELGHSPAFESFKATLDRQVSLGPS